GRGAIATVWRVVERETGAVYAGKILHERHGRDPAASRRFVREAELAQQLVHENLVRVFGSQPIEGQPALLMELVEGPNLADYLARQGSLSEPEVLRLARGMASGLGYAHAAGVIHRDLKPANILLAPGTTVATPKIADFGMARASSFAGADKGALTVLGTPQYMAPECLEPLAVDPRTDLYALGCIIHEMATGAPPFRGATPFAVLDAHRNEPVPPLPEGYSATLRRLVGRLLAKAPGDRLQSAGAVVEAIEAAIAAGGALVASSGPGTLAHVDPDKIADGRCAGCGAAVLQETRLCFRCGLLQVMVERGRYSVFVTGPGQLSYKLGTELRDRLLRWLEANAAVGLDASALERKIPRIPFTLVTGVSERCAQTFRESLRSIGVEAEWTRGGPRSHAGIIRNTTKLARRSMAICFALICVPMMINQAAGIVAALLCGTVVYLATLHRVSRPVVELKEARDHGLPQRVQARLDELAAVVGNITERRHREALRAVVHRVIALSRNTPRATLAEVEAEMEHAIHLAAGATMRLDGFDRQMSAPDFDPSEPKSRELMHERDMWSARLLDLTATLDALTARRAAADAMAADAAMPTELDALRATVEALEEVQRA
ncbi:MAG: serine/threonine protein kinase, partial [Deltaproteobacteria bacterium]|nr:serine/threonine protein kinase [Deltaproteobacteria bacterium]